MFADYYYVNLNSLLAKLYQVVKNKNNLFNSVICGANFLFCFLET